MAKFIVEKPLKSDLPDRILRDIMKNRMEKIDQFFIAYCGSRWEDYFLKHLKTKSPSEIFKKLELTVRTEYEHDKIIEVYSIRIKPGRWKSSQNPKDETQSK